MVVHDPLIFTLSPILVSKQFIHYHVIHLPTKTSFYITVVYADNSIASRQLFLTLFLPFDRILTPNLYLGTLTAALELMTDVGVV